MEKIVKDGSLYSIAREIKDDEGIRVVIVNITRMGSGEMVEVEYYLIV